MELIDTHCHLMALEKTADLVIAAANHAHVKRMLNVGSIDGTRSAALAVKTADEYENVFAAVGIHPHDAKDYTTLEEIEPYLSHPKVVAIGETGLDFFRDWAPAERQRELFENSVKLALRYNKPLIIHSRDALEETLATLIRLHAEQVGGVFHCYSGDSTFAKRLRTLNFLVSFPGTVTFKKATSIHEAVKEIPLDQIMLETDCPYMAPEPYRGKPSEPAHVYEIACRIAELRQISIEEVADATTRNAEKLFGGLGI